MVVSAFEAFVTDKVDLVKALALDVCKSKRLVPA